LEFPPKTRNRIWQWIRERYASHILFHTEKKLAPLRKWKAYKEKQLALYRQELATLPAKIKALEVGEAYLVDFKEPHKWKMGVKRLPDEEYGTSYYSAGQGYPGSRFSWDKWGDSQKDLVAWAEDKLREEITTLESSFGPFSNTELLDLKMLQKECLRYASKAEPVKVSVSRPFIIDLTGWKYVEKIPDWQTILHNDPRFKTLTVVLFGQMHPDRGGQWSSYRMELQVDAPTEIPDRVSDFNSSLGVLEEGLDHEMRHLAQSVLGWLKKDKGTPGFPSKSILPTNEDASKFPLDPNDPKRVTHALRDVEFYTRLGDEVRQFLLNIKKIPKHTWRWALGSWVGLTSKEAPPPEVSQARWGLDPTQFFSMLKKHQPQKWRKAVSEFEKAVTSKIDIPEEEENLDFLTMHRNEPTRINPFGLSPLLYWRARTQEAYGDSGYAQATYSRETRDKLENDLWPQVKEEYRRFIDGLSPQQLLRHKQRVQRPGSGASEYYLTPRWERFNGQNTLEEPKYQGDKSVFPEHEKLVGL